MNLYSDGVWPSLNRVIIYHKSALLRFFNMIPKGGSGKTQSSKISLEQLSNIPKKRKKSERKQYGDFSESVAKSSKAERWTSTTKDSKGKTRMINFSSNIGWEARKVEKG